MVSRKLHCNTQLRIGTAIQQRKLCKHTRRLSNLSLLPCQRTFPSRTGADCCHRRTSASIFCAPTLSGPRNPLLSACAAMEGELHFDAIPIAPPGSEMLMHQKPVRRSSFGLNVKKAWYLGPCFNHYRTFRGILPSTGGEKLSDTVKFQHHAIRDWHPGDNVGRQDHGHGEAT